MAIKLEEKTAMEPLHSRCFACGGVNADGLGLVFSDCGQGCVSANCSIGEVFQGYSGIVQGGIVATILDSAMTNCLFSQGVEAMTVRLNVQYRKPVLVGKSLNAEAKMIRQRGRVYELEARITQGDAVKASATGRFMVADNVL